MKVLAGGGDAGFIRSSAAGRFRREVAHIKLRDSQSGADEHQEAEAAGGADEARREHEVETRGVGVGTESSLRHDCMVNVGEINIPRSS